MMKSSNNHPRKAHKNSKAKPGLHIKKVWIVIMATGIVVAIALFIYMVVFSDRTIKLSDVYDKCKGEFIGAEIEAEEANSERVDATIFFKPSTSRETLESMASIMNTFGKVKSVEISTSEEEYQKFLNDSRDDKELLKTLADEEMQKMMLESMEAVMRVKALDYNDLSGIRYVVESNPTFRKNISDKTKPSYNTTPPIGFGSMELFDNGNTLVMETEGDDYADKLNCVCTTLEMPYRIKDAIGQTAEIDRTRQDEWGNLKVEWSYSASNKKLHIVIYQK